jgi:hypothetical protein
MFYTQDTPGLLELYPQGIPGLYYFTLRIYQDLGYLPLRIHQDLEIFVYKHVPGHWYLPTGYTPP